MTNAQLLQTVLCEQARNESAEYREFNDNKEVSCGEGLFQNCKLLFAEGYKDHHNHHHHHRHHHRPEVDVIRITCVHSNNTTK